MRMLLAALAVFATLVGTATLARGQTPIGGEVPGVLSLSLGEPTDFRRVRTTRRRSVYTAVVRAEATATEVPVELTVVDGEALAGRRRGHLVLGTSALPLPLRAASGGPYRSLDARVAPSLRVWRGPLAREIVKIGLRQEVRRGTRLHRYHKDLLVTLTAGGP